MSGSRPKRISHRGFIERLEQKFCLTVVGFIETNVQCCTTEANVVHATDFDGDGDIDVISSAATRFDKLLLFENDGTGRFAEAKSLVGEDFTDVANSIDSADLDGDGDLDFVAGYSGVNRVGWFENTGDGSFTPQTILAGDVISSKVRVADVDGDGDVDILSAHIQPPDTVELFLLENLGDGQFSEREISTDFSRVDNIEFGDIDADGNLDLLVTSDFGVAWLPNVDGNGTFGDHQVLAGTSQPLAIRIEDFDGDGFEDVVSSLVGNAKLLLHQNSGDPAMPLGEGDVIYSQTLQAFGPASLHASDLDGDGDLDVVSTLLSLDSEEDAVTQEIRWLENEAGSFGEPRLIVSEDRGFHRSSDVADLNGDGLPDFLIAGYSDQVTWYPNLGNGEFGATEFISVAYTKPRSLNDFDGDGDLDLLARTGSYSQSGDLVWFDNPGNGAYHEARTIMEDASTNPSMVEVADIDGDGDPDLVTARVPPTNDRVRIDWHENDSSGAFREQSIDIVTANSEAEWTSLALIDFDQDEDLDLIAAVNEQLLFYRNEGLESESRFGNPVTLADNASGLPYTDFELVDLNEDEIMDLVTTTVDSEQAEVTFSWSPGSADGFDDPRPLGSIAGSSGATLEIADTDGDGDLDVNALLAGEALFVTLGETRLVWFENLGANEFRAPVEQTGFPGGYVSFELEDFDRDGDLDALAGVTNWNSGIFYFEFDQSSKTFGEYEVVNERDFLATQGGGEAVAEFVIGDVDGDGKIEVIAGTNRGISIFTPDVVVEESLTGDANGDGSVTFADFLILSENFGQEDATRDDGDFNGDNRVSFEDFLLLSANFGQP